MFKTGISHFYLPNSRFKLTKINRNYKLQFEKLQIRITVQNHRLYKMTSEW